MADKEQLLHDFVLGMHQRACTEIDDDEWETWQEAGEKYYGEETYQTIYRGYTRRVSSI